MSVNSQTRERFSFKKLLGKSHISNGVPFFSESRPNQVWIDSTEIISANIPSNPQTAVDDGLVEFVEADLQEIGASNGLGFDIIFPSSYDGFFGNSVQGQPIRDSTFIIDQKNNLDDGKAVPNNSGGYVYDLRDSNGDSISVGASEGWLVDPVSTVLTSEQEITTLTNNGGTVRLYIYIGDTLRQELNDISSGSNFTGTTDDVTEGSTNLYFTDERAQDASLTVVSGSQGITWNYDDSNDQATVTLDNLNSFSTDDISEGSANLYFTDERAQDAVGTITSGGTDINVTYDDTNDSLTIDHANTGSADSSNTLPTVIRSVSTDGRGHVDSLSTGTFSGGTDISISGSTIDHASTGGASSDTNNSQFVRDITFDGRGHAESITTQAVVEDLSGGTDITVSSSTGSVTVDHANTGSDSASHDGTSTNVIKTVSSDGRGHVDSVEQLEIAGGNDITTSFDSNNNQILIDLDGDLQTTGVDVSEDGTAIVSDVQNINFQTDIDVTDAGSGQANVVHANTGSDSSTGNSGGTVLQNLNTDGRGHVDSVSTITLDTDDINEGTGNLYFTDSRAISAIENASAINMTGDLSVTGDIDTQLTNTDSADSIIGTMAVRDVTISTNNPSGGEDGDVWFQFGQEVDFRANQETFSGDGSTRQFTFSHNFSSKPKSWTIFPTTNDASVPSHATADSTNITVFYDTAPPSGTDNVVLNWMAQL